MKATVLVRPKEGILDPQGEAVEDSLRHLGFAVGEARVGRVVDLEVDAGDAGAGAGRGRADVRAAAREPADRELRDRDRGAMSEPRPKVAVVVFPGSNDDRDAAWALGALGADAVLVWHADERAARGHRRRRPARRLLVRRLPPLRRDRPLLAGDGARSREFAADGGPVLGICNGFQILCEAGLLPGRAAAERVALVRLPRRRAPRRARRHAVHVALRARASGSSIPVKHGEGCWFAAARARRRARARTARSCCATRARTRTARSATSRASCNERGNVMGLMPHPEHAVDPLLGSGDGALILASLVDAARDRALGARLGASLRRPSRAPAASSGCFASAARRRSRSRSRSVTGPRRADAVGRVREADEPLARRVSSSWTTDANRLSPARCCTRTSSTTLAAPHGVVLALAMRRT